MKKKITLREVNEEFKDYISLVINLPDEYLANVFHGIVLWNEHKKETRDITGDFEFVSETHIKFSVKTMELYENMEGFEEWQLKVKFIIDKSIIYINVYNSTEFNNSKFTAVYKNDRLPIYLIDLGSDFIISNYNLKDIFFRNLKNITYNENFLEIELNNSNNIKTQIKSVYFKNRTAEIVVYLEENLDNKFFIAYSNMKIDGIWDMYAKIDFYGYYKEVRISAENVIMPPKTVLVNLGNDSGLRKIRPYSSQDGYLSLLVSSNNTLINNIEYVKVEDNLIEITGYFLINGYDKIWEISDFTLLDKSSGVEFPLESKDTWDGQKKHYYLKIDHKLFHNNYLQQGDYEFRFNLYIEGKKINLPLVSNFDDIKPKSKIINFPSIMIKNKSFLSKVIKLKYSTDESLHLIVTPLADIKLIYSKVSSKFLILKLLVPRTIQISQPILQLKNSLEELFISPNQINDGSDETILYKIPLSKIKSKFFLSLLFQDLNLPIQLKTTTNSLSSKFFFLEDKDKNQLTLERKNNTKKIVAELKWGISKFFSKIIKKIVHDEVWLVGENLGEVAQDNGFAFFEFCLKNNLKEKVFYVSKKDNKNIDKLLPYKKNVLISNTFKHMLYYNLSKYNIVSHGIRDVMPNVLYPFINQNQKPVIYLQHGIVAMKKLFYSRSSYNNKIVKFVVSSHFEKEIFIKYMNFREDQLIVTGLARFDNLKDQSSKSEIKKLLIMPTWRDGIADSYHSFINSSFYKYYGGLLKNSRLHDLIRKQNLVIEFYPHIELQKNKQCLKLFENLHENIRVVTTSTKTVKSLLEESTLMITDYSSVAFDFAYMDKPVLFFQFDLIEYLLNRGAYIDMEKDLIGPVYYTVENLINGIEEYILNDYEYDDSYREKLNKHILYKDELNSKRIYEEIINIE